MQFLAILAIAITAVSAAATGNTGAAPAGGAGSAPAGGAGGAGGFLLFIKVVELLKNKAHLNLEGLHKIINIKASINLGISSTKQKELINEFKIITPVARPIIFTENIPDPY